MQHRSTPAWRGTRAAGCRRASRPGARLPPGTSRGSAAAGCPASAPPVAARSGACPWTSLRRGAADKRWRPYREFLCPALDGHERSSASAESAPNRRGITSGGQGAAVTLGYSESDRRPPEVAVPGALCLVGKGSQRLLGAPQNPYKSATRRLIPTGIPRTERHTAVHLLCVLKYGERPLTSAYARELGFWSFSR